MATSPQQVADEEWFPTLSPDPPLPLPLPDSHPWTSPPFNAFFVRGPSYLHSKAKVPAGPPLLQPIASDLIKHSSKLSNIMDHPHCRVRAALIAARKPAEPLSGVPDQDGAQDPFVWAFNMQFPSKEHYSLVMYYVSFQKPEKGSLMQRFLDGDDAFRRDRLKLLINIPQGPRVVKLAVGEKGSVCVIGNVSKCTYIRGKDYMEVDIDLGSSVIATAGFQLCAGLTAHATVDIGFAFEGRCAEELPERILGAMRFASLDFSAACSFESPLLSHESEEKDKEKGLHKSLWRALTKVVQAG